MANPVVRPCSSCGKPETRRSTSTPTCGPRCYQRLRRQRYEQTSSLDFQIGGLVFTLTDVPREIDHDILRRDILERCGDDLRAAIEKLHPIQQGEQR